MKKDIKTWLPVFSGFYNTIWELDTEYIVDIKGKYVDYDRMKIDNDNWEKDVCEHIISELSYLLEDFSIMIRFKSISSPSFYNFSNDRCIVSIDIDEKAVSKYIYDNKEEFIEYLGETFTSYDGYNSNYSNKFSDWEEITNNFTSYSDDMNHLNTLLEFICESKDITGMNLRDSLDIYAGEYIEIQDITWDDADIDAVFEECINELDLEYGDVVFEISDAKRRAELFSTDWKDELSEEVKIKLLEAAKLTPDDFES